MHVGRRPRPPRPVKAPRPPRPTRPRPRPRNEPLGARTTAELAKGAVGGASVGPGRASNEDPATMPPDCPAPRPRVRPLPLRPRPRPRPRPLRPCAPVSAMSRSRKPPVGRKLRRTRLWPTGCQSRARPCFLFSVHCAKLFSVIPVLTGSQVRVIRVIGVKLKLTWLAFPPRRHGSVPVVRL